MSLDISLDMQREIFLPPCPYACRTAIVSFLAHCPRRKDGGEYEAMIDLTSMKMISKMKESEPELNHHHQAVQFAVASDSSKAGVTGAVKSMSAKSINAKIKSLAERSASKYTLDRLKPEELPVRKRRDM